MTTKTILALKYGDGAEGVLRGLRPLDSGYDLGWRVYNTLVWANLPHIDLEEDGFLVNEGVLKTLEKSPWIFRDRRGFFWGFTVMMEVCSYYHRKTGQTHPVMLWASDVFDLCVHLKTSKDDADLAGACVDLLSGTMVDEPPSKAVYLGRPKDLTSEDERLIQGLLRHGVTMTSGSFRSQH